MVKQEGTTWTVYDTHDDISDLGYTVATDGQGKVISVTDYFVVPEGSYDPGIQIR